MVLCGTWSETSVASHNWLSFGKFQDKERFLIHYERNFSSRLPPSGGTWKYAKAPSTKKSCRDSLPFDMLLSAVSVLVVAQSISEIPEGLMNNPVYFAVESHKLHLSVGIYNWSSTVVFELNCFTCVKWGNVHTEWQFGGILSVCLNLSKIVRLTKQRFMKILFRVNFCLAVSLQNAFIWDK